MENLEYFICNLELLEFAVDPSVVFGGIGEFDIDTVTLNTMSGKAILFQDESQEQS